jgi:antitoxin component YwqK of YwqJK toxin-antitoxin module
MDGLSTRWYRNGHKRNEWIFKDGEMVKRTEYREEDGSVRNVMEF